MPNTRKSENTAPEGVDCFSCRMVSGVGLLTAGGYVLQNNKVAKTALTKEIGVILGVGLLSLGFARLANVWPFQERKPYTE